MLIEIQKIVEGNCECGQSATKQIAGQLFCPHCGDGELVKIIYTSILHLEELVIKTKFFTRETYEEIKNRPLKFKYSISNEPIETGPSCPSAGTIGLSSNVSKIIGWAREYAIEHKHRRIVPEHWLIGVLETSAFKVNKPAKIHQRLLDRIEAALAALPDPVLIADQLSLPFSNAAKECLEQAAKFSTDENATTINSRRLILAIMDGADKGLKAILDDSNIFKEEYISWKRKRQERQERQEKNPESRSNPT
jgi:hypothetical protein